MRIKNVLNSRQYKGGGRKIKESAELRTAEAGGCVCLAEAERIAYYNKTNNRKIREWIGRTEKPKKQRVSLTKSSVLKPKQHNNQKYNKNEIYVSTGLVFKPLGVKQSSRYCQKLSRILFPPVSLSIILTLISFRNPWWPSSVKCLKNSAWGTEAPELNLRLHAL